MFADDTKVWKKFRIPVIEKILKPSREIY